MVFYGSGGVKMAQIQNVPTRNVPVRNVPPPLQRLFTKRLLSATSPHETFPQGNVP